MKHLKYLLLLVCCCITVYTYAKHADTTTCTADCCCAAGNQTPLGIMTDHVHGKGEWMASYTWTDMMMKGNRTGTTKISTDDINRDYAMAPEKMTMQMHMVMLMYGVTDRLTLMGMGGYTSNNMSMKMASFIMAMPSMQGMQNVSGDKMTSKSSAFADTRVYALYSVLNKNDKRIIASLGVNIPTGSSTLSGPTMFGAYHRLTYAMQTGGGTFGLLPSVTYIHARDKISWGAEADANVNFGTNHQGYTLGNTYDVTAWGSYQVCSFMSASLRAEGTVTGKIKGNDMKIEELRYNDPSADGRYYGGKRVMTFAGLNFSVKKLKALHLLFEFGMPVYENLNGIQMSSQANLLAGVQYTF